MDLDINMEEGAKICSNCLKVVCDCSLKSEEEYSGKKCEVHEAGVSIDSNAIILEVSMRRILVKNFHGKVIQVDISTSTTVLQLLDQVESMSGVSFTTKILLKGKKILILTNKALKHFQNDLTQPIFYYESTIWSAQKYMKSILKLKAKDLTLDLDMHRSIFSSLPLDNLRAAVITRDTLDYYSVVTASVFSECSFFALQEISGDLISHINTLNANFIFSKASLSNDFTTLHTYSVIFALADDFWIEMQETLLESGSIVIIHSSSKVFNGWTRLGNMNCSSTVYYILVRNIHLDEFSTSDFFDQLRKLETSIKMQYERGILLFNGRALEMLKPNEELNFTNIKGKKNEIIEFFNSFYSGKHTKTPLIQRFMEMILLMVLEYSLISINSFSLNTEKVFLSHGIQLIDIVALTIACLYNEEAFNIRLCIFNAKYDKDKAQYSEFIKKRVFNSSLNKSLIDDFKLTFDINSFFTLFYFIALIENIDLFLIGSVYVYIVICFLLETFKGLKLFIICPITNSIMCKARLF